MKKKILFKIIAPFAPYKAGETIKEYQLSSFDNKGGRSKAKDLLLLLIRSGPHEQPPSRKAEPTYLTPEVGQLAGFIMIIRLLLPISDPAEFMDF